MGDAFDAAKEGDLRSLETMMKIRPRLINTTDDMGRTLLHIACRGQHVEMVEYLLSCGVGYKTTDKDEMTAAHYAVSNHSDAESVLLIIRIIANYASDIFSPSGLTKDTLLHRAAKYGHVRLVHFLVHEIKARHTQPSIAALKFNQQVASSKGSPSSGDGTSSDNRTRSDTQFTVSLNLTTSMHTGGRSRRARRRKVLLPPYGTREFVNLRNSSGETALLLAAGNSRVNVVQSLLGFDADVTIKDHKGRTPFTLSRHWAVSTDTVALRNRLKPCLDYRAPILSITPAGACGLTSPPQSPRETSVGEADRLSPLSYRENFSDGTLTPKIDLLLEFARAERRELLEKKNIREVVIKKKLAQRDRLLGRSSNEDCRQDGDDSSDEGDDEADDKNQIVNAKDTALTPYHTAVHKIDCKALELCSGMEHIDHFLQTTGVSLSRMGCKVPDLVTSSGDPVSTLIHNKSLRKIRHRLAKLETTHSLTGTDPRTGDLDTSQDKVALSSLLVLVIFISILVFLKNGWSAYNLYSGVPIW